ncbi:kinase-like protein [Obba rivulosa]|uniref:Kinase-like protein n=1 Tax=Obba rivulosa TaxID=1052685 RepID=A0A8E2AGQ5_9APHY|nr:kinase-like protein [Obba rivulosa]
MAELITVAGLAITVPGILSAAWSILKTAYDIYGSVDIRRKQIGLLLDRCRELLQKIAESLPKPDAEISDVLRNGLKHIELACQSVKSIPVTLCRKGFLWCMVNVDKIDLKIQDAESKISDAFRMFNLVMQLDRAEFQAEMVRARERDEYELSRRLEQLSESDQHILEAIQDQNGVRMQLTTSQHVQTLPEQNDSRPEDAFIRSAANALHRVSKTNPDVLPPDWVLSSLEVDFDPSGIIGQGSFGRIYNGEWNGALNLSQVVAIKQMYTDDARTLSGTDRRVWSTPSKRAQSLWRLFRGYSCTSPFHHLDLWLNNDPFQPFLVIEYCCFGNILQYLEKHPNADRTSLSYDIVLGLLYLHNRGIVHADMKCVNVLVSDNHRARLTDFGLSLVLDDIRSRSAYSTHAHAASLGVTIWEVFSGKVPFAEYSDRILPRMVVDRQQRPARPQGLSQDVVWDIVQKCWAADPASRPSAAAVQQALKSAISLTSQLADSNPLDRPPWAFGHELSNSESEWTRLVRTYPPQWTSREALNPTKGEIITYVDSVTLLHVLADKPYQYRVVERNNDLGVRESSPLKTDGSQTINLHEYNGGRGIQHHPIKVFVVDPVDRSETLLAERKAFRPWAG